MRIEPEYHSASIVLIGDFNPPIFTPDWFLRHGLLTEQQRDVAEVQIIHPEISKFQIEGLTLNVTQKRLSATLEQPPWVQLADLLSNTFGQYLVHTPIRMVGINKNVHFELQSRDQIDRFGQALAPWDAWGEWQESIAQRNDERRGGLRSLTMEQGVRDDAYRGRIGAKVEPSARLELGVFVEINDHYDLTQTSETTDAGAAIEVLSNEFDKSQQRAEWIIDQLMNLGIKMGQSNG